MVAHSTEDAQKRIEEKLKKEKTKKLTTVAVVQPQLASITRLGHVHIPKPICAARHDTTSASEFNPITHHGDCAYCQQSLFAMLAASKKLTVMLTGHCVYQQSIGKPSNLSHYY